MAEDKKTDGRAAETGRKASAPPPPKAPELLPASQSSDPAVHQVLAEIQTARANADDDAVERLSKSLAELGYQ